MTDIVAKLRDGGETCGVERCNVRDARSGCVCAMAADEIERLRSAIYDWAQAVWLAEGVLFLDGQPCEQFIMDVIDAERLCREGEGHD